MLRFLKYFRNEKGEYRRVYIIISQLKKNVYPASTRIKKKYW